MSADWIKHYGTSEERLRNEQDEDALFDHYTLRAAAGQGPMRLDVFLTNLLPFTTRSKIKSAFETGSITVNGGPTKLSYKIRPGDEVKVMLPYPPPPELEPEDIPLDIRYEDEHLMILYKPAGMVCHPSLGHRTGTLVHALLWHFKNLPMRYDGPEPRPGLVHRIDKDTTGIIAIAKSEFAMAHLSRQFFDRTPDREYQAIVWGDVKEDRGTIDTYITRNPSDRKFYLAVPEGDGDQGKHAITHYEVLERFGVATLVRCKLETGRTHQIRVHMKYIGHTLFGDKDYGGDKILKGPNTQKYRQFMQNCLDILPRQGLHARTLAITHPVTGERLSFESDLPDDMVSLLQRLRDRAEHES